eukprot:IDg3863t1
MISDLPLLARVSCPSCEKRFKTKATLRKHSILAHKKVITRKDLNLLVWNNYQTLKKRKNLKRLFRVDISKAAGSLEANRTVSHGSESGSMIVGPAISGHGNQSMNVAVLAAVVEVGRRAFSV